MEVERLHKLNSTTDPVLRERLEATFEMERARVIQQLQDLEEYWSHRNNKKQVQLLADRLGVVLTNS